MATSSVQIQDKVTKHISSRSSLNNNNSHQKSNVSSPPFYKDGIAVCEKCGTIGVKNTFITKERKFCSIFCAKGYSGHAGDKMTDEKMEEGKNGNRRQIGYKFKLMESSDHLVGMVPAEPLPHLPGLWEATIDDFSLPVPRSHQPTASSFQWADDQLFRCDFLAAPVRLFSHAPLSDLCDNIFEGMKVEVKNRDCCPKLSEYFWVATVIKLKGYMGLLRYEGFGNDDSKDFWVNLMNWEVYPVGWCATRGKPLIPPQTIENKYSDWKTFLVKQLTGARTLPTDFYNKIADSLKSRFRLGHILEVVDKNKLSQVKVAYIDNIIEKRLHVRYYDSTPEAVSGFWCHQDSPLIHPVGWARSVGHELDAPVDYIQRLNNGMIHNDDTKPDMFKSYVNPDPHNINFHPHFSQGMEIEAIDPLNLSSICQATVMRVLLHGYIMIRIDCYPPDEAGADWFCYHQNSPYILPAGFCKERGIRLTIYIGQSPEPPNLPHPPPKGPPPHGFVSGMRLECVDLMEPRLVCVATISRVVGRLLKVHFDGWGDEYDQWLDCESTDIYPVGWCKAVGHRLEGPPAQGFHAKAPPPPRRRGRKKKISKLNNELSKDLDTPNGNHCAIDMKEDKKIINVNMNYENEVSFKDETYSDELMENKEEPNIELTKEETAVETEEPDNAIHMDTLEPISEQQLDSQGELEEIFEEQEKSIPRLVGNIFIDPSQLNNVEPETWEPRHVIEFLSINDCAPYSDHFAKVNGKDMLNLTKDEIIELLQMKVGPSLKIFDLIQQLKCKLKKSSQPTMKHYK